MIKVALHIPNIHDATNFYRGSPTFANMRKKCGLPIDFDFMREYNYAYVDKYDVAFFQRPSTEAELEAMRLCKRRNVPVIVDFDDLLFDVPIDNAAHQSYMNGPTQKRIAMIMNEADCIWVSTRELKRCIQIPKAPLNDRVFVVPNAIDDQALAFGDRREPTPFEKRSRTVLWRGSNTHFRDVMDYTPETVDVARSTPQTLFTFVGWNPWFMTEQMLPQQALVSGALPVGEFMDFVRETGAWVGIVPLNDSKFNQCKSNIAWLEMSWAGGVALAPDWEEWRHPGVVTYRTPEDYKAALKTLVSMEPQQLDELNKMSWDHIKKHFLLSDVNRTRYQTILALLGREPWPAGGEPIHDPDVTMELE